MFPSNHLVDDVLLIIFDHLRGLDLIQCEAVCSQWRGLLLSGTPWKRWLHRRVTDASFAAFRETWRKMEVDEGEIQTAHYRSHCRAILQQLEENNRNWRSGNMEESLIRWLDLALPQQDYFNQLELNLINGRIAVHLWARNAIKLFYSLISAIKSKVRFHCLAITTPQQTAT
jgi:F-box-like